MICATASDAAADWSVNAVGNLHYTDDVALFSATRRLNLHGDPTQPVLDSVLTGKGSDMVFEPDLNVAKSFASQWGRTEVSVRGQAFVYTINPRFNHGSFDYEYSLWGTLGLIIAASILMHGVLVTPALKRLSAHLPRAWHADAG